MTRHVTPEGPSGTGEAVLIRQDAVQAAIVRFVEDSALRFCTTSGTDDTGTVHVAARWPVAGFSSGEKVAWRLLQSLASGDLRAALTSVDDRTLGALAVVFAASMAVTR